MHVSAPKHIANQPLTVRVAMWSARHAWPVAILWFVGTLGLFAAYILVGLDTSNTSTGEKSQSDTANASAAFTAAGIGGHDNLTLVVSHPTQKVTDPAFTALVTDLGNRLKAVTYNADGVQKPVFLSDAQHPIQVVPSPDLTAIFLKATVDGPESAAKAKLVPIKQIISDAQTQHPDYSIKSVTNTWINDDFEGLIIDGLRGSLVPTLIFTAAILLIAFGALVAAVVPLVLGFTALAAAFGAVALYSHSVTPVDPTALEVVVIIGLAVGIDYSLFLVSRYRTERRRGRDKLAAIEVASATSGRAVFFSGITVMISLAGLFVVNNAAFRSIAVGAIIGVFITIIGSLTFLPATLAILGNGINGGRIPYFGRERDEGAGFWGRFVGGVMRHPIIAVIITAGLMLALAAPTLHINLGSTTGSADSLPPSLEGVQAIKLLQQKWPLSGTLTMNVVVVSDQPNRADVQTAIAQVAAETVKIAGISPQADKPQAYTPTLTQLTFYMTDPASNAQGNRDIVSQMRHVVIPAAFGSLQGVNAYVTGSSASIIDTVNYYTGVLPLIFAFVLGFSFLLLLVVFHSIVIPIKAILLNLLSTGACYGALVLVFQDNWLIDTLGVPRLGVIESYVPAFVFTILFGLSMDYHLFILTRIKEAKDRGLDTNTAVAKGITITSGTITSAAAIMVAVFLIAGTINVTVVKQLGLGLALAVFLDSTIIRSVLLPATMRLLGDLNWYLPPFLKWLPQVTLEGESEETDAPESAAPDPQPITAQA